MLVVACHTGEIADPARREARIAESRQRVENLGRGHYVLLSFRPTHEARYEFLGSMHFLERFYGIGFEAEIELRDATGLEAFSGDSAKLAHPDWPYSPESIDKIQLVDLLRRVNHALGKQVVRGMVLFDEQLEDRFVTIADVDAPSSAKVTRHDL